MPTDAIAHLNAALASRYVIERELEQRKLSEDYTARRSCNGRMTISPLARALVTLQRF